MTRFARPVCCAHWLTAMTLVVIAGCATDPRDLKPEYVSPYAYRALDCAALDREMTFAAARSSELYRLLQERYQRDQWQAAFVWAWGVTAPFLDGDGPEAVEYRRLQGRLEALRIEAYRKDCGLTAPPPKEVADGSTAPQPAPPERVIT